MPDRRREQRFRLREPANAMVRVFVDVTVRPDGKDEWIATSREPAVAGETLILDVVSDESDTTELRERFPVCVVDSRPVILDGDMRHRIRLHGGELTPLLLEQQLRRGR